jgi:hypothetical protein
MKAKTTAICALILLGGLISSGAADVTPAPIYNMLVMGEFLKELPDADRHEFLSRLVLSDGRVVSTSVYKPLLEKTLKGDRIKEIVAALSPAETARPPKSKVTSRLNLSDLLKGVPPTARNEFLDSMTFINGELATVHNTALKEAIGDEKTKGILNSLFAFAYDGKPVDSKTLCGDGWCDDTVCVTTPENRVPHCEELKGGTCRSTCGD